ncbi:MAG: SDR family oxidoreductase [Herpetosiphonaceae bacterium]|nr:SDR family oxidoreductase [Herpetosiphonaceae bacterium]
MRFAGKVALVTGAAQGIGRATALRFAQDGADVVIADVNLAGAEESAREIDKLGCAALAVQADVTDEHNCEQLIAAITERFGHLDIVFANAGIGGGAPVNELPAAQWDRVIAVNLRGVFLTCKYSIPALIKAGGGAIITMSSSMAGWDTSSTGAAYMASKEGVSGLTKSLALQLGGHGIRVNAICPGVIQTRLDFKPGTSEAEWQARYDRFAKRIPLRRVGQPEDVAAVVAFLASDDARHMSGSLLLVDGGQTLQSWSNAPNDESYPLDGNW